MLNMTRTIALGGSTLFFVVSAVFAWPSNPELEPPPIGATRLNPMYRVSVQRAGEVRTPNGDNLIKSGGFSDPSVLLENGKYRMWFTAVNKPFSDGHEMGIAYAESDDGLTWRPRLDPDTGEPVLLLRPTPDGWDSGGVESPQVVKGPEDKYFLFYTGDITASGANTWSIGLAISDDGITWTKVGDGPVLDGEGGWDGPWYEGSDQGRKRVGGICEPAVIYDAGAGLFRIWFSALGVRNDKSAFRIGYATSGDGITWERRREPVFEPDEDGSWDDTVVSQQTVVLDPPTGYHMFYFGTSAKLYKYAEDNEAATIPGSIGHAFSSDGITWERDANPVLSIVPGTWESWMVGGPTAIIEADTLRLWYFGSREARKYEFGIGHATSPLARPGSR